MHPVPYWRGIYDDKGRTMVAMVTNSDLGDSLEWADDPYCPEAFASLGIRLGVNYVLYDVTHQLRRWCGPVSRLFVYRSGRSANVYRAFPA
ncbi:MAG TPA: DUF4159 domain-containing protein [Bryobacteraceae bacterium]